eukprot:14996955-Alexandrium_andersonii.AAC.1
MSASLVGSEMCIRDSVGAPRRRQRSAGPGETGELGFAVGASAVRGRATVSYTHLTLPTICSV